MTDPNPQPETALVLGATGGIGAAITAELRARGIQVTGLSRADGLDWADPPRAEAALQAAGQSGPFGLVFDATGALVIGDNRPEKSLKQIDARAMAEQFAVNALGPALLFKHHAALIPRRGSARIATLSARVGSIGDNRLGGWISYRAAKAALNQITRTASIEIARYNPQAVCAALHPGTVRTGLSAAIIGANAEGTLSAEDSAARLLNVLLSLTPAQSGGFFAYDGSPIPW
ncbi:MAG: SDR family NAD(P)-dependent oxidoreductase [Pseudomonadota bacterium]